MIRILILLFVVITMNGYSQQQFFMIKKEVASFGTININFGNATGLPSNYNGMVGNPGPNGAVRSIANLINSTGANTGISISSVATANWATTGTLPDNENTSLAGTGAMTCFGGTNTVVDQSLWYQTGLNAVYNVSIPQLQLSGLNTAHTYTLTMTCSDASLGFDANTVYRVVGATTPASQTINGNTGGANQTSCASFTIAPAGDGTIKIYLPVSVADNNNIGVIQCLRIVDNG